jgi:hypothetical protein
MTGLEHFQKAEELAAKAGEYLGQGDGQDSAAVWAAVAQVHATLALASAAETVRGSRPPRLGEGSLTRGARDRAVRGAGVVHAR